MSTKIIDNTLICHDPDCRHHIDYHHFEPNLKAQCMWRTCKCEQFRDKTPVNKRHRL